MIVYRIDKTKRIKTTFDGYGARISSGRWHNEGIPLIYTASYCSLAILEKLVHIDKRSLLNEHYSIVPLEFLGKESLIQYYDPDKEFGTDWKNDIEMTRAVGDAWFSSEESLSLKVPSALSPVDSNYLFRSHDISDPDLFKVHDAIPIQLDQRFKGT